MAFYSYDDADNGEDTSPVFLWPPVTFGSLLPRDVITLIPSTGFSVDWKLDLSTISMQVKPLWKKYLGNGELGCLTGNASV